MFLISPTGLLKILLRTGVLSACVAVGTVSAAQTPSFLVSLGKVWIAEGLVATNEGAKPISCDVDGSMRGQTLVMASRCEVEENSANLTLELRYSPTSRTYRGELSSPLNYLAGSLDGDLVGDAMLLDFIARDGSTGTIEILNDEFGAPRVLMRLSLERGQPPVPILDMTLFPTGA